MDASARIGRLVFKEPAVGDESKRSAWSRCPQPDLPVAKMFFSSAENVADTSDVILAPNSRSRKASVEFQKLCPVMSVRDDLNIHYVENPRRGPRNSHETIHAMQRKSRALPHRPRKHALLTTTASNCMVQAVDCTEHPPEWLVAQQEKTAVLGESSVDESAAPTDKQVCFHWEKPVEVWEDIFHHYALTSLVVASVGRLPILQAAVRLGLKTTALCRNEVHMELVRNSMVEWLMKDSETNEEAPYFVSRAGLIEQYGLPEDMPGEHPAFNVDEASGAQPAEDEFDEASGAQPAEAMSDLDEASEASDADDATEPCSVDDSDIDLPEPPRKRPAAARRSS